MLYARVVTAARDGTQLFGIPTMGMSGICGVVFCDVTDGESFITVIVMHFLFTP